MALKGRLGPSPLLGRWTVARAQRSVKEAAQPRRVQYNNEFLLFVAATIILMK